MRPNNNSITMRVRYTSILDATKPNTPVLDVVSAKALARDLLTLWSADILSGLNVPKTINNREYDDNDLVCPIILLTSETAAGCFVEGPMAVCTPEGAIAAPLHSTLLTVDSARAFLTGPNCITAANFKSAQFKIDETIAEWTTAFAHDNTAVLLQFRDQIAARRAAAEAPPGPAQAPAPPAAQPDAQPVPAPEAAAAQ